MPWLHGLWKPDTNSKKRLIIAKINLSRIVPNVTGTCVKNCLKNFISKISHPEMFFKKDVLKNFANFIGKHMCDNLFSAIVGLQFCRKRDSGTVVFLWILHNVLQNTLFTEHFRTTASAYRNNMPREFGTKCEKNESNDILITYL